jgi:endoglucanase
MCLRGESHSIYVAEDEPGDGGHIIVTFHCYEPFSFTHQGAPWAGEEIRSGRDIAWGKTEEQLIVERDFDGVAQ